MSSPNALVCCLAGNPNTGKTTIFNNLTGARQKVGNYAGVTVERIEGSRKYAATSIRFIDLPGAYSLNARSADEKVSRDVLLLEQPDLVVQVIDASHLGRNLQLTLQLLEMGIPLVIALNMTDEARKNGLQIFPKQLSEALGVPVIPTIGSKRWGMNELLEAIVHEAKRAKEEKGTLPHPVAFDKEAEQLIAPLVESIGSLCKKDCPWNAPWAAKLLLEKDVYLLNDLCTGCAENKRQQLSTTIYEVRNSIRQATGLESDVFIGEQRAKVIKQIVDRSMRREKASGLGMSERLDKILVNRFLGLPIFFAVMYFVFWLSVDVADPLIGLVDEGFGSLGDLVTKALGEGWLQSLIVDGVISGVGGVMTFVPQIMIMFFCISLLEAWGYLARAAFVIDRAMHAIGLHGRSFIPMLVSFGCNVPGVMATRSMENRRDRLTTMMALPFMSCGARLPVYLLITAAFFPTAGSTVIFALYLLGILVAVITAKIFRTFVFKGEVSPLVFEIPPYRFPTWRGVISQMWLKARAYLKKAGTIILAAAIVVWFLTNFPKPDDAVTKAWEAKIAAIPESDTNQIAKLEQQIAEIGESASNQRAELEQQIAKVGEGATNQRAELAQQLAKLSETASNQLAELEEQLELAKAPDEQRADLEHQQKAEAMQQSYAGRLGSLISPILAPVGLDDWKVAVALIAGFSAKEIVVGTMGTLYAMGDEEDEESEALRDRMSNDPFFRKKAKVKTSSAGTNAAAVPVDKKEAEAAVTAASTNAAVGAEDKKEADSLENTEPDFLKALSLMVFVLLYLPCQAVIGVFVKEAGVKMAVAMVAWTGLMAWVMSFIIYQGGRLLGF